jgi:hypothetical protein
LSSDDDSDEPFHSAPLIHDDEIGEHEVDEDSALAAALAASEQEADGVRAPLPSVNERLIDDFSTAAAHHLQRHVPLRNFAAEDALRSHQWTSSKARTDKPNLSDMFMPPVDLLFSGTMDMACAEALRVGAKWVLVNIQNMSDFESHCVNRDFWRLADMRALVSERFVFWQKEKSTEEGELFSRFYHVTSSPFIAVIQPLTKQIVASWDAEALRPMYRHPKRFLEQIQLCLQQNQLICLPSAKRTAETAFASSTSSTAPAVESAASVIEIDPTELTDDDMMRVAIQASIDENGIDDDLPAKRRKTTSSSRSSESDPTSEEASNIAAEAAAPSSDESPFSQLTVQPEPFSTVSSTLQTRLQFQLGSGRASQRRFLCTSTSNDLYAFVYSLLSVEEQQRCRAAVSFVLMTSFPKKTIPMSAQSLSELGLLNTKLVLEWL